MNNAIKISIMNNQANIDIDRVLVPNCWEILGNKEEGFKAIITDEEIDPFDVEFNGDRCANISTPLTQIVLSANALRRLADMVDETEVLYGRAQETETL